MILPPRLGLVPCISISQQEALYLNLQLTRKSKVVIVYA